MKYTPRSLEDLAAERLWPEAVYPFKVKSADDATSKKSGKDMIVLELMIFSADGKMKVIKDYIVEDQLEKLAQFCRFAGIEDLYNSGNVNAIDMANREGYVKVKQDKQQPGTDFPPKNSVGWYCPKPEGAAEVPVTKPIEEEDEIPF